MRKRSIGQWLVLLGSLVSCIGILLNAFEITSLTGFRVIVCIGIIIELIALIVIWKKSEF